MSAIFLSDVHLRDGSSVKTKLVVRFLEEKATAFQKLYILGDLFDSWPGTTDYLIKTYEPVVKALKRLTQQGHEIHYVEGNHDFRLGNFFRDELGIHVHPDGLVHELGGKRVYMMHGDLGNPKEFGYRMLRYVLRRNTLHKILGLFPEEVVFKAGLRGSQLSRDYRGEIPKKSERIREIYRQTATRIFKKGYDIVLMGHIHLPDDYTVNVQGRTCRYINTGDWVQHFTYLEFDGSEFYTRTHPVKDL